MGKKKEKPEDKTQGKPEDDTQDQEPDLQAELEKSQGTADSLSKRLHTELVRATGRLSDPTDLEFNAEHLEDSKKLDKAITELLTSKPHLKARKVDGDAGQGKHGKPTGPKDFSQFFRN